MIATKKKKKRNRNIQLFFVIVLYATCVYRIFTLNKMPQEAVFSLFPNILFYHLLSIILLTINTITLPFVVRRQKLMEQKNYYLSLFYLLLSLLFPIVLDPLSQFVGLVFILGIFPNLFDIEEHNINRKLFLMGLCVGVLGVIYFPFAALLFFAYLSCLTYRRFNFRLFFLPIASVLLPFIYWYSALYILGYGFSIQENILQMKDSLLQFQFFEQFETKKTLIFAISLSVISLVLIYLLNRLADKSSLLERKKYYILLILFLFSIIFALSYSQFYVEIALMLYAVVLAVLIGFRRKKKM